MQYVDPADGWTPLERFTSDWDALQQVAFEAFRSLHSCCNSKAVHDDLNQGNLLVRYALRLQDPIGRIPYLVLVMHQFMRPLAHNMPARCMQS